MSLHFSANQYEVGYKASRLGNWELGRVFAERPRQRKGPTRVIADDRGHLLPGVPRTQASPWGPLTQAIDPHVSERQRRLTENLRASTPEADDEDAEGGGEGTGLKVTGEGLLVSGERSEDEGVSSLLQEPQGTAEGSRSGTITPATFRRPARNHNAPSVRTSSRSSASVSLTPSSAASSNPGSQDRILKEASKLPPDTVEDALLPRRPEEELTELTGSRALAIRLVDHPAPTNCTKYVVLRPNTAPSPAPTTKPPLLPKRPKTSKVIRKVPEIEFALKWDLKESDIMEEKDEDEEAIEVVSLKKGCKGREPPSPRSVSSVDSGVHAPKTAWNEGPDTRELASKLESLDESAAHAQKKGSPDSESGYGSPKSRDSLGSLPSVGSRASSGRGSTARSIKLPLKGGSATPEGTNGRRISIDAQKLAQEDPKVTPKSRTSSGRSSASRKEARSSRKAPAEQQNLRDPLTILETMDSVFHTVPLRETGRETRRTPSVERHRAVAATQTEEELAVKHPDEGVASEAKVRHNHPGHLRSRNCLACEVRAIQEPPKKFQGPSDYKPAFRAGKPQHNSGSSKKPKYLRQSDRYQARLRTRCDPPRYWSINTLSSPFCNRSGYGQDQYPDHMRLRTTYAMAHAKGTKPAHAPFIKKLYL